ncbi:MAG: nucleotidyltransferase domain-containing protein [archaeon]
MDKKPQKDIHNLIKEAINHYYQILEIQPRRIRLQTLKRGEWHEFCKKFNLISASEGIFLPRNLTAYLLYNSNNLPLNLFHEYFGHGLFCEYSKKGKFIEHLEKRLLNEEKAEFRNKRFTSQELSEFRRQNSNFKLLQQEKSKNLELYETFAIWTEQHLSNIFRMNDKFEQKYKDMPIEINNNLAEMLKFQQNNGDTAFFYKIGMPKYYDGGLIKNMLEKIYGTEKIKNSKLGILYGSRKPYSDIDLFVVSDGIKDFKSEWLDIYSLRIEEFEHFAQVLNVSVTDPLFTGEFIFGDRKYFEQKKNQILNQPITKEAIYHNLNKSKEQKILASTYMLNSEEQKIGNSYAETYMKNAISLMRGEKRLTKKSLIG